MTPSQVGRFFLGLPHTAAAWDRLEQCDPVTIHTYWTEIVPRITEPTDCPRAIHELCRHGRVWVALDLLTMNLNRFMPETDLVMDVLEIAFTSEAESSMPASLHYEITMLLDYLESSEQVNEGRLAQIEWALVSALRLEKRRFRVLDRAVATDPKFFADLVTLAYRATDEEPGEDADEQAQQQALAAHSLLETAELAPGTRDDGTINAGRLEEWVSEARRVIKERRRLAIGEQRIGHLLQKASADADGTWPPIVIRNLFEKLRSNEIERGFEVAIYNGRGIVTRRSDDGGDLERQLAAEYRRQANKLKNHSPRTAALFKRLADGYESDARMFDRDAERWQERS